MGRPTRHDRHAALPEPACRSALAAKHELQMHTAQQESRRLPCRNHILQGAGSQDMHATMAQQPVRGWDCLRLSSCPGLHPLRRLQVQAT